MDAALLDAAGALDPPGLRSLDALHLCAATALERALECFVAYDKRPLAAAEDAGMAVAPPGA